MIEHRLAQWTVASSRLRKGQAAAEYGLVGAILGIGAIAVLSLIGGNLRIYMNGIVDFITAAVS